MLFQPGTHIVQLGAMLVRRRLTLQKDVRIAAVPAKKERSSVSVTNRRVSLHQPAPRAVRTAISFWRPKILANNKLARFAQARKRTNAAAACSSRKSGSVNM